MRSFAWALLVLGACTIEAPPSELSNTERAWVEDALPVLEQNCTTCHDRQDGLGFLAGDTAFEIRGELLESGVVDPTAPEQSPLLTKGAHAGPALTWEQADALVHWLRTERR